MSREQTTITAHGPFKLAERIDEKLAEGWPVVPGTICGELCPGSTRGACMCVVERKDEQNEQEANGD